MNRDIIIIWSNCDSTYITLNGYQVGYGIERGYEVGDALIELFKKLRYSNPLIVNTYDEDYFSEFERSAFYNRGYILKWEDERFFTEGELQVLYETEDVDKFIAKVKENLKNEEHGHDEEDIDE